MVCTLQQSIEFHRISGLWRMAKAFYEAVQGRRKVVQHDRRLKLEVLIHHIVALILFTLIKSSPFLNTLSYYQE